MYSHKPACGRPILTSHVLYVLWKEACTRVVWLSYSIRHVDLSFTLTMDFSNLWKHRYRFSHASFHTLKNYTWLTAISSVTVSLLCQPKMSVFNSHIHDSHSVISKLRRITNYLRSSVGKEKLNMLSVMSMKHEILGDTDLETIINDFACKKFGVMKLFVVEKFFFQKAESDRDQGASINSLLSIFCNLTPLQLPYNALT